MCYNRFFCLFFFFHVASRKFKTTYVAHSIHVGQQDARVRSQQQRKHILAFKEHPILPM